MPSFSRIVAAGILSIAFSGCGKSKNATPDSSAAAVQSAIQAEIERSLDATRRKDINTFIDGFLPDFLVITPGGSRITRDTLRANTLRDWSIISATRDLWMRIDSVGPVGSDTAVVYTAQRWDRLMLERDGVTRDTVVTTQKHREVWRMTAGRWRRAEVKELGGAVEVNGKPFTDS